MAEVFTPPAMELLETGVPQDIGIGRLVAKKCARVITCQRTEVRTTMERSKLIVSRASVDDGAPGAMVQVRSVGRGVYE